MGKIYIITNPMPLHNNSPVVSLGKFTRVVTAAGYVPEILGARLPENGIPGVADDVKITSYPYGGKSIFKLFSMVWLQMRMFFSGLLRYKKDDSLYFWIADKMIGSFLAARLKGANINYFLFGRSFKDGENGLSAKLVIYMMNRATRVCAEAPAVFKNWDPKDSVPRDCIRLFVPESPVKTVPFDKRDARVAMFSRLSPGKHVDDSVRAFVKVHEAYPEYSMTVIGGGVLEDEIRSLIHELGADSFITVTGWLDSEKAKEQLAGCRVLLYPTDAEGVPGSVLEAMSLGVPALASPAGGIPDVIDDGTDGVILTACDSETICRELTELLESGKLPALAKAAEQKILREYSLEYAAENFRRIKDSHS